MWRYHEIDDRMDESGPSHKGIVCELSQIEGDSMRVVTEQIKAAGFGCAL
jgi:hypothetical protein